MFIYGLGLFREFFIKCCQHVFMHKLANVPGVTVVGEVKDVNDELNKFTVSVAPMRMARGLQNKVLEAMAAKIPVVLSSKAAKGISGKKDETYLVANSPDHTIRCISRLLSDPNLRKQIGQTGYRFVSLHHNWIESLRKYELIATGVIDKHLSTTFVNQALIPSAKTVIIDPKAAPATISTWLGETRIVIDKELEARLPLPDLAPEDPIYVLATAMRYAVLGSGKGRDGTAQSLANIAVAWFDMIPPTPWTSASCALATMPALGSLSWSAIAC